MGDFLVGGVFGMLLGSFFFNILSGDVTVESVMQARVACDSLGGLKDLNQGFYNIEATCNNGVELVVKREYKN